MVEEDKSAEEDTAGVPLADAAFPLLIRRLWKNRKVRRPQRVRLVTKRQRRKW